MKGKPRSISRIGTIIHSKNVLNVTAHTSQWFYNKTLWQARVWSNSDKSWDKNPQKRAGENKGKNSKRPILQNLNWSTGDGGIGHLKILLNNQIHWKHGGLSSTTWCFDGFLDYPWYIKYTLWLSTTDITCSLLLSVLEDCRKINWRPTKQTVIGWSFFVSLTSQHPYRNCLKYGRITT